VGATSQLASAKVSGGYAWRVRQSLTTSGSLSRQVDNRIYAGCLNRHESHRSGATAPLSYTVCWGRLDGSSLSIRAQGLSAEGTVLADGLKLSIPLADGRTNSVTLRRTSEATWNKMVAAFERGRVIDVR